MPTAGVFTKHLAFLNIFLFLTVFSSKYHSRFNLDASSAMKSFFCSHSEDSSLLPCFQSGISAFLFFWQYSAFPCCCTVAQSCPTLCDLWTAACQASLYFLILQSLLRLMSTELMMSSNHSILCHPHLLLHPIFRSIRIFSNELALRIRWPKYWSFSFSISPSNEYSGLISFRIDWFDLLAVQSSF